MSQGEGRRSDRGQRRRIGSGPWWLARRRDEIPSELDWLSSEEREHLAELRVEKRRDDWLLGRWAAKSALRSRPSWVGVDTSLADLTVRQAADGAPEALLRSRPLPLGLSLSHRGDWGLCALAPDGVLLGCDIETVEARSPAFLEDYFTTTEQSALQSAPVTERDRCATLMWAVKESALKALRVGLRADTRRIQVGICCDSVADDSWRELEAQDTQTDRRFGGWSRMLGELVLVVVTSPRSEQPIALDREL